MERKQNLGGKRKIRETWYNSGQENQAKLDKN